MLISIHDRSYLYILSNIYFNKTFINAMNTSLIKKILRPIKRNIIEKKVRIEARKIIKEIKQNKARKRIFYLGVTENNNIGDNAQFYCINQWIKKHYPTYKVFRVNASIITESKGVWLKFFINNYNLKDDFIIFQSGYNTQDHGYNLGYWSLGNHELMHRLIADNLPEAKILMMPQTIFFQNEKYKRRTSESYNKCKNMLFLARDEFSYQTALDMFPNIKVELYPDIVTTLIGKFNFNHKREGIFLCTRNDNEKFYKASEIENLYNRLSKYYLVDKGDTQSNVSGKDTRKRLQYYITSVIEQLSKYKVVITDRYHGTILSLCANTPVIIIKSNDHKVISGANWFKGIYDDYVYIANDLDDAYNQATIICNQSKNELLSPYFEEKFYDKLPLLFNF